MGSGMFKPGYSKVRFKYTKMFFIACLLHAGRQDIDISINDYFYDSWSKLYFSIIYDTTIIGIITMILL